MKRQISTFLALILCFCAWAQPVTADSVDPTFIELLDYGFSSESGSNTQPFGGGSVLNFTYSLPDRYTVQYVDVVFTYTKSDFPSVDLYTGSTFRSSLSVVNVSGNVFRAYGSFVSFFAASLKLVFTASSTNSNRITIESFKVGRSDFSHVELDAYCDIAADGFTDTIHYVPTDTVNHRMFEGTTDYLNVGFNLYIYCNEWKRFDYLDFLLYLEIDSISAISCVYGGSSVPITVNYIDNDSMVVGTYTVSIRMDLTGLDRSIDDYPMIMVSGNVAQQKINLISMLGCVGHVNFSSVDPDTYWHSKIVSSFQTYIQNQTDLLVSEFSALESINEAGFKNVVTAVGKVTTAVSNLNTTVSTGFSNLNNWISVQTTAIQLEFSSFKTSLSLHFSNLNSWITDQTTAIETAISTQTSSIKVALRTHFQNLDQWIETQTDTLVTTIKGDASAGDDFQDDVADKDDELDQMQDVMDSVTRPALDKIDVSVDSYVTQADVTTLTSPLLVFLTGDIFGPIAIMSILMATVGYVLYGKR